MKSCKHYKDFELGDKVETKPEYHQGAFTGRICQLNDSDITNVQATVTDTHGKEHRLSAQWLEKVGGRSCFSCMPCDPYSMLLDAIDAFRKHLKKGCC